MRRFLGFLFLLGCAQPGCYTILRHPEPADVALLEEDDVTADYSDCRACHLELDPYAWYPQRVVYYPPWDGWPAQDPWWWAAPGRPQTPRLGPVDRRTQGSGLANDRWPRPIPPPVVPVADPGVSQSTDGDRKESPSRGASEVTTPAGGVAEPAASRQPTVRNDELPESPAGQSPPSRPAQPAAPAPQPPGTPPAANPTPAPRGTSEALPNERPRPAP